MWRFFSRFLKRLPLALGAGVAALLWSASAHASLAVLNGAPYTGHVGISTSAWGSLSASGTLTARVPPGATVTAAYLYTSSLDNFFSNGAAPVNGGTFGGSANTIMYTPLGSTGRKVQAGRADVTAIVKPVIDAGTTGVYDFAVTEINPKLQDGEVLVVVYELNSLPVSTVAILDGFSVPTGDTTTLKFGGALDTGVSGFFAEMRLGIGFSCANQTVTDPGQISTVTVNGTVITRNAGNYDKSVNWTGSSVCSSNGGANGQMITMGGDLDPFSPLLPSYAQDKERYDLNKNDMLNGKDEIKIDTLNPSGDDNIFLAVIYVMGSASVNKPPQLRCTASPNPAPADATTLVTITCTDGTPGSKLTIPGSSCDGASVTGPLTCTGTGASLGNNPPATMTDATDSNSTVIVPLQIAQSPGTPLPPQAPACKATPSQEISGQSIQIDCTGGQPNAQISIPNATCPAALDGAGSAQCGGTAGTGAGQINSNPSVTVTDPVTNLSNSGTVPFQVDGSATGPQLPVCTASPDPASASTTVTIDCKGGQPNVAIAIPNATCPDTLNASGDATCIGVGGNLKGNPLLMVTDPATGETSQGSVPLNVDTVPPAAPVCTASPSPAQPGEQVDISCVVDIGAITFIPGANCPATAATVSPIDCGGVAVTGAALGNNPPATSTDAAGNNSTGIVPLQIEQDAGAPLPPKVPVCTSTSLKGVSNSGPITIICTGGEPDATLAILNATCPNPLDGAGNAFCTGNAGTGPGDVSNNPPVTVTDTITGLSNNGVVPFQINGNDVNPLLPTCSASPNAAGAGVTVTITCTGGAQGNQLIIPNTTDCAVADNAIFDASGTLTCHGVGGSLGGNPPLTVSDPAAPANTSQSTVPLNVRAASSAPQCTALPGRAAPAAVVEITCTGGTPGDKLTIPGSSCTGATVPASGTLVCDGTGASLGNNPPATAIDALGGVNTSIALLQITGTPLPPKVPVCAVTSPAPPVSDSALLTITCQGGEPGAAISIPNANCSNGNTLDASGDAVCTGMAGAGAGAINNNPSVTVTDTATGLSNSSIVPFQIGGSTTDPALPVCMATPGTAGAVTDVSIDCTGGTVGDTVTIPGSSCNGLVLAISNFTCTGTGGSLKSNPPILVTNAGGASQGTVSLNAVAPPNPPQCTATPNPASPAQPVSISCTVDLGTTTYIPGGVTCNPDPATAAIVTCTGGTGATLGNNPPVTSTDAWGGNSISTVPLQITGANLPPMPACVASPSAQTSGGAVSIACTGGTAGHTVTIPGTSCTATPLAGSPASVTCTGTAGTGAGQINSNPSVTVTNPVNGQSNSGIVPFQLTGAGTPVLPGCTASPNPANASELVTITCTGGTVGDQFTIPGSSCGASYTIAASSFTCTGTGSALGSNPPIRVTNPVTGAATGGSVYLTVLPAASNNNAQPIPTLGEWSLVALTMLLLILNAGTLRRSVRR